MSATEITASNAILLSEPEDRQAKTPVSALVGLLVFLIVLILRPADFVPALQSLRLAALTFGLALFMWLLSGQRSVVLRPLTSRFAVGLMAIMAISIPFSCWPSRSFEESVIFLKQLTVFFLIANVLQTTQSVRQLLAVVAVALAFHAVVVIKRFASGELILDRVFGAAGGIFSDPNDLALNFVMMWPVCLFFFRRSQRIVSRSFFAALLLLFGLAIVATQSRGGFLGLSVITGMAVLESRRKLIASLILVMGIVVALFLAPSHSLERYKTIGEYHQDASAMTRLQIWNTGLRMWADHPFIGVGAGTFPTAYGTTYRDPTFADRTWYDAHNSAIKVMAELGTPGLIMWLGMILAAMSSLRASLRCLRNLPCADARSDDLLEVCRTLRGMLIGYLVCGFFLSRSYDWMLMVCLGLIVACAEMTDRCLSGDTELVELLDDEYEATRP